MLGALILQVMEKDETEAIKVMIYLVESVLPEGYFCGSMIGLQADMAVFRDLMQCKLPQLAAHLQKLQGPIENAYEPPLTNVFTMQWFLTLFCTCLPMSSVLRVWDLVLIEGSEVLLRTALVLWGLLEGYLSNIIFNFPLSYKSSNLQTNTKNTLCRRFLWKNGFILQRTTDQSPGQCKYFN